MTTDELFHFIDDQRLAVLASVSPSQMPEAAIVGFAVTPDLDIIFDTLNTTRKYTNLIANPHIAFVIGEGEITLQYEGIAGEPRGAELARAKDIYFRKWPECRVHEAWPGITYFLARPLWIRYSDYYQSPPYVIEREFQEHSPADQTP